MRWKLRCFFSIFWWWERHCSAVLLPMACDMLLNILSALLSELCSKWTLCSVKKAKYWQFSWKVQCPRLVCGWPWARGLGGGEGRVAYSDSSFRWMRQSSRQASRSHSSWGSRSAYPSRNYIAIIIRGISNNQRMRAAGKIQRVRADIVAVYKGSLERALHSLFDRVLQDDLISTLREQAASREYVPLRVAEITKEVFESERELALNRAFSEIDMLNDLVAELKEALARAEKDKHYAMALESKCTEYEGQLSASLAEVKILSQQKVQLNVAGEQLRLMRSRAFEQDRQTLKLLEQDRQSMAKSLSRAEEQIDMLKQALCASDHSKRQAVSQYEEVLLKSSQFEHSMRMLLEEREDRARQLSDELARAKADIEDFAKESERALLASRDKFQAEVDRLREELREVRGKLKEAREGLRLEKQQRSAEGNALQQKYDMVFKDSRQASAALQKARQELSVERQAACRLRVALQQKQGLLSVERSRSQNQADAISLLTKEKQRLANQLQRQSNILAKLKVAAQELRSKEEALQAKLQETKNSLSQASKKASSLAQKLETESRQRATAQSELNSSRKEVQRCRSQLQSSQHKSSLQERDLFSARRRIEQLSTSFSQSESQAKRVGAELAESVRVSEKYRCGLESALKELREEGERGRFLEIGLRDRESDLERALENGRTLAERLQSRVVQLQGLLSEERLKVDQILSELKLESEAKAEMARRQDWLQDQLAQRTRQCQEIGAKCARVLSQYQEEKLNSASISRQSARQSLNQHRLKELLFSQLHRAKLAVCGLRSQLTLLRDEAGRTLARARQQSSDYLRRVLKQCSAVMGSSLALSQEQFKSAVRKIQDQKAIELRTRDESFWEQSEKSRAMLERMRLEYDDSKRDFEKRLVVLSADCQKASSQTASCKRAFEAERQLLEQQIEQQKRKVDQLSEQGRILKNLADQDFFQQQLKLKESEQKAGQLQKQNERQRLFYEGEIKILEGKLFGARLRSGQKEYNFEERRSSLARQPEKKKREPSEEGEGRPTPADRILAQLKQDIVTHKKQLASWRRF